MKKIRIALTGGGSGGHIYPLIAVAQKIFDAARRNSLEVDVRFFGSPGQYRTMLNGFNIPVSHVLESKWRRYFSPLNFLEPFRLIIGLIQTLIKMYFFMPDVIFSKGGSGSVPIILSGVFYHIPIIIHESDAIPGIANRLAARFARRVGLAFDAATPFFTSRPTAVVGNPVREELLSNRDDQALAKRYWGFHPEEPVILVLGGSQGAEAINDFIIKESPQLLPKFQILHQTGINNFEGAKGELTFVAADLSADLRRRYHLIAYFKKDLKEALSAADIVVSRAGAGSIFEIAAFGKPAILIPLPNAAGDHQRYNANEFASAGAGVVIEESNLLSNVFLVQLNKILGDKERAAKMSAAALSFFKPHTDRVLADEIIRLALS